MGLCFVGWGEVVVRCMQMGWGRGDGSQVHADGMGMEKIYWGWGRNGAEFNTMSLFTVNNTSAPIFDRLVHFLQFY